MLSQVFFSRCVHYVPILSFDGVIIVLVQKNVAFSLNACYILSSVVG